MRSPALDDVFFALSNATRRDIVARLSRGPARILDIADPFDVSLNTVSKHIKVLERAGSCGGGFAAASTSAISRRPASDL
jgi:DNA-binding transcriptional ArsR family regulator